MRTLQAIERGRTIIVVMRERQMRRQDAKTPRKSRFSFFSSWRLGVLAAHFLRVTSLLLLPSLASAAELKAYDTPYYTIYTDLDRDSEREAAIRMTKMAEEYHDCTKDFSGVNPEKFPFYLYRSPQDYYDAGGLPGTAGVFIGDGKLMAIAGQPLTGNTWHAVQHEGFHQFAHAAIPGQLPIWLSEGWAEYFGEGLFTGDGFVMGVIPNWRLKRLKESITNQKIKSIRQIMLMSPDHWRSDLSIGNYDQAWSMVHFLIHGEGGKYQHALSACIKEFSAGRPFDTAWLDTLEPAEDFEKRWKVYWLSQPANPTSIQYSQATVSTLTSFLARAAAEEQRFESFEQFTAVAKNGKLKMSADDWLPVSLLNKALLSATQEDHLLLHIDVAQQSVLTAIMSDGTRLTGTFNLRGGHVAHVEVIVQNPGRAGG
jgi:hypothetical protein